eukprot:contig_7880_g1857
MSPHSAVSSQVLIVGAGPTGYTTAAALAEAGFQNVTILDARPDATMFEWERAYSLVLTRTGQRLLESLPKLGELVKREAICQHVRVDAVLEPDGGVSMSSRRPPAGPMYWLLKTRLLEIMDEHVRSRYPRVRFITGASVKDVVLPNAPPAGIAPAAPAQVKVTHAADGREELLEADLLVACDGSNSVLRTLFSTQGTRVDSTYGTGIYSRPSPATGMCHKGVVLEARPIISAPGVPVQYAQPSVVYTLRGARGARDARTVFDMLLLPVDVGARTGRRGAITVPAGHALMEAKDADEALQLLRDNFPQLRVDECVSQAELQKFVTTTAAVFPPVVRPHSLVARFRDVPRQGGVMFIGDAAHSFPPDSSQGVNSALQDVDVLLRLARSAVGSGASLHDLLSAYEAARHAETWALMELVAIAAPYQYGQNRVGSARAAISRRVRSVMAVVAPGVCSPHVDTLIRQGLTYRDVRRRDRRSVAVLWVLAGALLTAPLAVAAAASRGSEDLAV